MKIINHICRSEKYKGLQIATFVFDDNSRLLLTPAPLGGERVEAEVRKIKKGCEKNENRIQIERQII